jgi:hypothetical protein
MDKGYGRVKAARAITSGLWQNRMMNAPNDWPKRCAPTCGDAKPMMAKSRRQKLVNHRHVER